MSFSGDLEYLSIIDVIQLMHTTRKTGTLRINGRKGEISLAFDDGYITGARHYEQGARIGNILLEAGVISNDTLEKALQIQTDAGDQRKPLIATMLENGLADKDAAYRALEALIEVTIVEILTWKKGKFELDANGMNLCDEFRYFPEKMNEHLSISTEHVLMDALRIYDEKKRDGLITDEEITSDDLLPEQEPAEGESIISADDLGLGDLGAIKRKIPGVYEGLKETKTSAHQKQIAELSPKLGDLALVDIASYLDHLPAKPAAREGAVHLPLILYSPDKFVIYCITTVCRHVGINVFTSSDTEDIAPVVEQYISKKQPPILLMDIPDENNPAFTASNLNKTSQQFMAKHPELPIIQLSSPHDYSFWLQTFQAGAKIIIPRPSADSEETFIKDFKKFLGILPPLLESCRERSEKTGSISQPLPETPYSINQPRTNPATETTATEQVQPLESLHGPTSVPEAAMAVLNLVSGIFDRSITLVVRDNELIAEKGIGIGRAREEGPGKVLGYRIPAEEGSIFRFMLDKGYIFYGKSEDRILQSHLHRAIGTPLHSTILLLPLKLGKKIVSITYADFGQSEVREISTDTLETFAKQASIALENSLQRKSIEKSAA